MPSLTRRRALQGAAGLLAALAGCNERTSDPPPGSPTVPADRPGDGAVTDPAHLLLRAGEGPAAWFDAAETGETPSAVGPEEGRTRGLIASERVAETLSVADGAAVAAPRNASADATPTDPVDGAAAASEFVAATDFDSETLFLDQRRVGECYRLELCYVDWTAEEFDIQYGRVLRDHDVACRADASDAAAVLVRVPAALDPDERSGYTSGVHGGGCDRVPPERRPGRATPRSPDETATETTGGSDE